MSTSHLAKLAPSDRITMRVHGWLITLYALAIGYGANLLCLQVPLLQAKVWRWPITVGALYFVGFVLSFYIYVKWWQSRVAEQEKIRLASLAEINEFIQEKETIDKGFQKLDWFIDWTALMEFFPPIAIIVLPFLIIGVIYFLIFFPVVLTDWLAGLLAELLIEFALGLLVINRAIKSTKSEQTLGQYLQKICWGGLVLVAVVWLAAKLLH
jgi:hypothetical protein